MRTSQIAVLLLGSVVVHGLVTACTLRAKGGSMNPDALADGTGGAGGAPSGPTVVTKPCGLSTGFSATASFPGRTAVELARVSAFMRRAAVPDVATQTLVQISGTTVTIQDQCNTLVDDDSAEGGEVLFVLP